MLHINMLFVPCIIIQRQGYEKRKITKRDKRTS